MTESKADSHLMSFLFICQTANVSTVRLLQAGPTVTLEVCVCVQRSLWLNPELTRNSGSSCYFLPEEETKKSICCSFALLTRGLNIFVFLLAMETIIPYNHDHTLSPTLTKCLKWTEP